MGGFKRKPYFERGESTLKVRLSSACPFSRYSNDGHGRAVVGKHTHVPGLEVRLSEPFVK
jgi:hypothetical protein